VSEAEVCSTCRFWLPEPQHCRRHAPSPIAGDRATGNDEAKTVWPATDPEDWCGEYEPVMTEDYEEEVEEEFEDDEWAADGSPAW
jgi:hypothetical protein